MTKIERERRRFAQWGVSLVDRFPKRLVPLSRLKGRHTVTIKKVSK